MAYTNEQIKQAVATLPPEFQEALAGTFVANKILEIGKRHGLNVEQTGRLHDIALLSLLGLIPGTRVAEVLVQDLALSEIQAETLVEEITTEIFSGIRHTIREQMEIKNKIPVQEEENLDRDEILRGIENPHPATPNKAPSAIPVWAQPKPAPTPPPSPVVSTTRVAPTLPQTPAVSSTPLASPAPAPVVSTPPPAPTIPPPPIVSSTPSPSPAQQPAPVISSPLFSKPNSIPVETDISSPSPAAPPVKNDPPGASPLATKVSLPPAPPTHADAIASIKKVDPYREPVN